MGRLGVEPSDLSIHVIPGGLGPQKERETHTTSWGERPNNNDQNPD